MNPQRRAPKRSSTSNRLNASPPGPTGADAGPRPLSARQRAMLANELRGEETAPARPDWRETSPTRRRVRDSETTYRRVPVRNRRRSNYPRLLLGWAAAALVAEGIGLLLFSPRLWVREVTVEGNKSVPTTQLLKLLPIPAEQNIVRLSTGKMQSRVLAAEPTIETAEIRRVLPGTVRLIVTERKPWASVKLAAGVCYTIDEKLIPFRKSGVPEAGLPLLVLAADEGEAPANIPMGKSMSAPGLSEVSKCLLWATHRDDFPLESVEIDPQGKLCLNRMGGMKVLLGSGVDLAKKLGSLETLLEKRPGLRDGKGVAYINLFAWDALAVMPAKPEPAAAPSAVAASSNEPLSSSQEPFTEQP